MGVYIFFYEATSPFIGIKYSISNVFFSDICKIHMKMIDWGHSEHYFIRIMASPMKDKFDKYRDKCCLVLDVVVVFDPNYKMSLVEYFYTWIYGLSANQYIIMVHDTLKDLFSPEGVVMFLQQVTQLLQVAPSLTHALSYLIMRDGLMSHVVFPIINQGWKAS